MPVASIGSDAPAPEPSLPDGIIGFEQQQVWIERTQVPAIFLTLIGVVALCLSV